MQFNFCEYMFLNTLGDLNFSIHFFCYSKIEILKKYWKKGVISDSRPFLKNIELSKHYK